MTMDLLPIPGEPVLLSKDDRYLVVADLHIGIESHLRWRGFHVPSRTDHMLRSLLSYSQEVDRVILLGDIKHRVPGTTRQEVEELPGFFRSLCEAFDHVDIVKGNHDGNIESFLSSDVNVHPAGGFVLDDVGFVHGHTWPSTHTMKVDSLVMAHNHPTVMFVDGVGKRTTESCWMRGAFINGGERYHDHPSEFVVMPAFNPMLGGSPINVEGEKLLGPILNSDMVDLDACRIHLLDGICLGRRAELMVEGRSRKRRRMPLTRD